MLKNVFTYRLTSHRDEFRNLFLLNVLGNMVLLLPWGILAPLSFKRLNYVRAIALTAFCISFSAEVLQYTFSLGVFDVDDLMFNTIGAVAGFYLLQVSKNIFKKIDYTFNGLSKNELKRKSA